MDDHRPNQQCPLPVWDLPASLLTSVHTFRKRSRKEGRKRKHFPAILAFIYRNRFATVEQVRRRFPNILRSARTARRHLAEMHDSLGYLHLVPTPSPLWPKVFSMSQRGVRALAEAFKKNERPWEPSVMDRVRPGFSIHHVIHELFCTEFLLSVHEAAKAATDIELLATQRRSLAKNEALVLPCGGHLIPDAMFVLRLAGKGMVCTFLEIDTGSMSLPSIAKKLRRYATWADSEQGRTFVIETYGGHGARNPRAMFRVAIVCGGSSRVECQRRMNGLLRIADDLPESIRNAVWLTTTTGIRDAGQCILRRSIWLHPVYRQAEPIPRQSFLGTRSDCAES